LITRKPLAVIKLIQMERLVGNVMHAFLDETAFLMQTSKIQQTTNKY
jgi:hypothetical protein